MIIGNSRLNLKSISGETIGEERVGEKMKHAHLLRI
jgi:hypothetical protein